MSLVSVDESEFQKLKFRSKSKSKVIRALKNHSLRSTSSRTVPRSVILSSSERNSIEYCSFLSERSLHLCWDGQLVTDHDGWPRDFEQT